VTSDHPHEKSGILLAGGAYAIWGVVPLYWQFLVSVPPFEITVHRVFWCALFCTAVMFGRGRFGAVLAIARAPRMLAALALSSVLISVNWTVFIYSVSSHQLVDSALGYYLTPLVSIVLGVTVLGEKISPMRIAAIGLASVAVAIQAANVGHLPWIAPVLALTFGFYGYVRKLTPVDSLDGLTVETVLLFPLTAVLIGFWAMRGTGAFPSPHWNIDALLIFAGPLTAVPLSMFAAGARRVRLTTLGFLQYVSPTITLLVATLLLHETFTLADALTFAFVWSGIALLSLEGRFRREAVVEPVEL
jgi:chloramphenicol-sensitive protein RarD